MSDLNHVYHYYEDVAEEDQEYYDIQRKKCIAIAKRNYLASQSLTTDEWHKSLDMWRYKAGKSKQ
jgi:hypothetical protein